MKWKKGKRDYGTMVRYSNIKMLNCIKFKYLRDVKYFLFSYWMHLMFEEAKNMRSLPRVRGEGLRCPWMLQKYSILPLVASSIIIMRSISDLLGYFKGPLSLI